MKRSEYMRLIGTAVGLERAAEIAEEAGVTWDPEWPPGFEAFWLDPAMNGLRVKANQHACLAAWNACLSRQEAQQRTIERKVDPEVRRKEIEAQIEAWLGYYGITPGCPAQLLSRGTLRNMALRLLGVL